MSKSLARVCAALDAAGVVVELREMQNETRTAQAAAWAAGCGVAAIVKSILFQGESGQLYLFLTAGDNQVDVARASALAGEALGRADPQIVRKVTGFAIGGVAPLGHLTALPAWMEQGLTGQAVVWAAAGTPRHIFAIAPAHLLALTGAIQADFAAKGKE
jgi:prolyl-tRNA editing enzyme YbaK/EbsC (Cys-tRNA(Pro) deacylase)